MVECITQCNIIGMVEQALAESTIIKAVKSNATPVKGRKLTDAEIDQLKKNGNYSSDWGKITVADDFITDNIWGSYLHGTLYIGRQSGYLKPGDDSVWYGIANANLFNCEIMNDVTIIEAKEVSGYRIHSGVVIHNVGTLAMDGKSSFGIGVELPIAIETGGREVLTYPEITVDIAAKIATSRSDKELIAKYNSLVEKYVELATSTRGMVEKNAVIKNCPKIINTYIGESARLDNALAVKNTTIYSLPGESTEILDGAYVNKSIVQWGAEVTTMAIVDKSVLTEYSHVERHGKATESIIGPNTGVAEGEVTASLVGPFVGFHHQSLLIAVYWPDGKGNLGYGANVGSNHTSKAPDQELWSGEGLFYGLGVDIKFPSDYSRAPYTIIASGVSALPQSMQFPFSLMNIPSDSMPGISPAYNELMPGWVLSDNIYVIKRNEGKYMKRNKAKRSKLVFEVFRPEIIDLMKDARNRLQVSQIKEVYTSKEIKGLGKSYMSEKSRQNGIDSYTFYIKYYGLTGLYRAVCKMLDEGKKDKIASLIQTKTDCPRWEHERAVLLEELPGKSVAECMNLLSEMEGKIAFSVEDSKRKDDKRGAQIIPDYASAHKPADQDGFVKETWVKTKELQEKIKQIVSQL
ncbi:MAG: DUF4954 family protein [Candidatus Auribacterota bacterium]|nr:DUF4954 family protein [Candidatus Auribacterota bacterium]